VNAKTARELYRYNTWANGRVFDAVARVGPAQFVREVGGSYPSLRACLTHIVSAEWLWLRRWKGRSPKRLWSPGDFPRVDELRARWIEVEAEQAAFVSLLTDDALERSVSYVGLQGRTWEYALWRQMLHVVNHSSYHRGQATLLLRLLGATPAPTDFLVFRDEVSE
jgi:uncharacterized damage-inducible protein DinB